MHDMHVAKTAAVWLIAATALVISSAVAQRHSDHRRSARPQVHRRLPPPHRAPRLTHRWQEGRWYQGRHQDRFGWWWIVGPSWFWYPAPVYPYPNYYIPPGASPSPNWYYCARPPGYYPYVTRCEVPWQLVQPTPGP